MLNMAKTNTKLTLLAAAGLIALVGSANAETIEGSASVTVQNAITIAQTTALSFGTIAAIADDNGTSPKSATLVMGLDGVSVVTSDGDAQITEITTGNAGVFTISGAAAQTDLTITLPSSDIDLVDPSGTESKKFKVGTFAKGVVSGGGSGFSFTTDDNGELVFSVGATLTTDVAGSGSGAADAYADTTYTGAYDVEVNY